MNGPETCINVDDSQNHSTVVTKPKKPSVIKGVWEFLNPKGSKVSPRNSRLEKKSAFHLYVPEEPNIFSEIQRAKSEPIIPQILDKSAYSCGVEKKHFDEIVDEVLDKHLEEQNISLSLDVQHDIKKIVCDRLEEECQNLLYDFCLIASEMDFIAAEEVQLWLEKEYSLKGYTISGLNIPAGSDQFIAFEDVMKKSYKILFYVTENFTEDRFYQRIQNGAVFQDIMRKVRSELERCVPIFKDGTHQVYVPLAISGIAGIELNKPKQIVDARIAVTFTKKSRKLRQLQEENKLKEIATSFLREEIIALEQKESKDTKRKLNKKQVKPIQEREPESDNESSSDDSECGEPGAESMFNLPISTLNDLKILEDPQAVAGTVNIESSQHVQVGHVININIYNSKSDGEEARNNDSDSSSEHTEL